MWPSTGSGATVGEVLGAGVVVAVGAGVARGRRGRRRGRRRRRHIPTRRRAAIGVGDGARVDLDGTAPEVHEPVRRLDEEPPSPARPVVDVPDTLPIEHAGQVHLPREVPHLRDVTGGRHVPELERRQPERRGHASHHDELDRAVVAHDRGPDREHPIAGGAERRDAAPASRPQVDAPEVVEPFVLGPCRTPAPARRRPPPRCPSDVKTGENTRDRTRGSRDRGGRTVRRRPDPQARAQRPDQLPVGRPRRVARLARLGQADDPVGRLDDDGVRAGFVEHVRRARARLRRHVAQDPVPARPRTPACPRSRRARRASGRRPPPRDRSRARRPSPARASTRARPRTRPRAAPGRTPCPRRCR